jgi:hypothetical protein
MTATRNIAEEIRVIPPFRSLTAGAMLAAMTLVLSAQALAEKIETQTREDVAAACEAVDGVGFGYLASSGDYGCVTDNAWIDCDEDGNCKGGVVTDDETTKQVQIAIRRWTQVSRAKLNRGPAACGGCLHLAVKAQHLDRQGDALAQEAKGLLRSAKLGKISNRHQAQTTHRRLEQLARQLNHTAVERKKLVFDYRSSARKANLRNVPKKQISTHQPTVRSKPQATRPPETASSRKQLRIN